MHLSNFFHSIKDSFIYKRRSIAEGQKREQPLLLGKSSPPEKLLEFEREEKDINVTTRFTYINDSEGPPTPLTLRLSRHALKKKEYTPKNKHHIPGSDPFLLEFILETENLGPILLRLERKGRHYNCSLFVESEEVEKFLYRDFEKIKLLLEDFLQKAGINVNFLRWNIFSPEEKERLTHSLEKERFLIDKRV